MIFDLDGTLIDSRLDLLNAVNVALSSVGRADCSVDDLTNLVGGGTRALVKKALGGDLDLFDKAFEAFTEHYQIHLLDHTKLYPGVDETLHLLKDRTLAVLSNKRQKFCEAILRGLGADEHFKLIMGGDKLSQKKPHPAPILYICEQLKVVPQKTMMVGDSPIDVEAGKAAGVITVGITEGFTSSEIMKSAKPHFLVPSVAMLPSHSEWGKILDF